MAIFLFLLPRNLSKKFGKWWSALCEFFSQVGKWHPVCYFKFSKISVFLPLRFVWNAFDSDSELHILNYYLYFRLQYYGIHWAWFKQVCQALVPDEQDVKWHERRRCSRLLSGSQLATTLVANIFRTWCNLHKQVYS